jgi:hypothetical protein
MNALMIRKFAGVIVLAAVAAGCAEWKQAGREIGATGKEVGKGAAEVGKDIGRGARDAAAELGRATGEAAREVREGVKKDDDED